MLVRALVFAVLAFTPVPASAQQELDQATLGKAIIALQIQRNSALDAQALAEARAALLTEEVAKLKAKIAELEKKTPPPAK